MPPAWVARFAGETDIFGLHLFSTQRSKLEVIFWSLLVLVFSGYTIKTLVSIVESYVNEDTVSYVYQKREANISFPFAELCVYGGEPAVKPLPIEDAIQSVLNTFEQKSISLNASAFVAVMDFLFRLQLSEKKFRLSPKAVIKRQEKFGISEANVAVGLRTFEKYSKKSLSDLFGFLVHELCRSMQIEITFRDPKVSNIIRAMEQPCESGYPASMLHNPFSFCIDIRGADFVYRTGTAQLRVTLNSSVANAQLGVGKFQAAELWLNSFIAQELESVDFESTIVIDGGTRQLFEVKISAEHHLLDLRRRRCSEESETRVWCASRCESVFFYAAYECWPLIYRYQFSPRRQNVSNVRLCNVHDYLNSTPSASRDVLQRVFNCFDQCFEPCTQRTYLVTARDLSAAAPVDPYTAVGKIFMQSFAHSVFEERLANDFESFLSSFGGALGLFLGASFASVIHIPLFLLQASLAYWRASVQESEKNTRDKVIDRDAIWNERFRALSDRLERIENAQNIGVNKFVYT